MCVSVAWNGPFIRVTFEFNWRKMLNSRLLNPSPDQNCLWHSRKRTASCPSTPVLIVVLIRTCNAVFPCLSHCVQECVMAPDQRVSNIKCAPQAVSYDQHEDSYFKYPNYGASYSHKLKRLPMRRWNINTLWLPVFVYPFQVMWPTDDVKVERGLISAIHYLDGEFTYLFD